MRLAIIGSRTFSDYERMKEVVDKFCSENEVSEIVSGGARGADALGAKYAKERKIPLNEFTPDFSNGFRVGQYFERNKQIVVGSDVVLAFWDKSSRGTLFTINEARDAGKKVIVEEF
jgi:predicted Rossmann fold nucleotide-binding protein DprA/Smf involved in DNA uptake